MDSAVVLLEKAIEIGKKSQFLEGVIEGYDYLARAEARQDNYRRAYQVKDSIEEYTNSKYELDKIAAVETVTTQYNLKQYKQDLRA